MQLDEKGHRVLVPLASEQELIGRITALHKEGVKFCEIARRLNAEGIPARRSGEWRSQTVSVILQREGQHQIRNYKQRGPRVVRRYDKPAAAARARELRAENLSLRKIGARLMKEGLVPLRASQWHPANVAELLRYRDPSDRAGTAQRANYVARD
jgi:hypothetical protein